METTTLAIVNLSLGFLLGAYIIFLIIYHYREKLFGERIKSKEGKKK